MLLKKLIKISKIWQHCRWQGSVTCLIELYVRLLISYKICLSSLDHSLHPLTNHFSSKKKKKWYFFGSLLCVVAHKIQSVGWIAPLNQSKWTYWIFFNPFNGVRTYKHATSGAKLKSENRTEKEKTRWSKTV